MRLYPESGYTLGIWLGRRIYVPSLVFSIAQLLHKVIVPVNTTIPSIVKCNNFCHSTRCEMGNHDGFYYHFPDYWWGSLYFKHLLAISVSSSMNCLSYPLHIYTRVVFLKNFLNVFICFRRLIQQIILISSPSPELFSILSWGLWLK